MCGHTVLQAGTQASEQPHVSGSGWDLGMLRVMSLDGVAHQASPAGIPGGEHCTCTAITINKPIVMTLKVGSWVLRKTHKHSRQTGLALLQHAVYTTLVMPRAHRSMCSCTISSSVCNYMPSFVSTHLVGCKQEFEKCHSFIKLTHFAQSTYHNDLLIEAYCMNTLCDVMQMASASAHQQPVLGLECMAGSSRTMVRAKCLLGYLQVLRAMMECPLLEVRPMMS